MNVLRVGAHFALGRSHLTPPRVFLFRPHKNRICLHISICTGSFRTKGLKKIRGNVAKCAFAPVLRTYSTKIPRFRGNLSLHRTSDLIILPYSYMKINRFFLFYHRHLADFFLNIVIVLVYYAQKLSLFDPMKAFLGLHGHTARSNIAKKSVLIVQKARLCED